MYLILKDYYAVFQGHKAIKRVASTLCQIVLENIFMQQLRFPKCLILVVSIFFFGFFLFLDHSVKRMYHNANMFLKALVVFHRTCFTSW